ncbi:hypothetical protein ACM66B_005955 [Microbotryomycetes sp. NB124-2]
MSATERGDASAPSTSEQPTKVAATSSAAAAAADSASTAADKPATSTNDKPVSDDDSDDEEEELDSNMTESRLFPANGQTSNAQAADAGEQAQSGHTKDDTTRKDQALADKTDSKDGQAAMQNGSDSATASDAKDNADDLLEKIKQSLGSLSQTEQDVVRRNIEAVETYPPELPLNASWTLHFSDTSSASKSNHGTTADQYDDAVKKVFVAETVPQLCGNLKAFKKLAKPKRAKDDSLGLTRAGQNLHFFRTGVSPTWEDPWNAKGGRLTISPPAAVFEAVYEKLMLLVAGSVLEMQATQAHEENKSRKSEERGQIIGVVASRRARGDRIEVWLGGIDKMQPPNSEWIDKLKESLSEKLAMPELRSGKYKKHF